MGGILSLVERQTLRADVSFTSFDALDPLWYSPIGSTVSTEAGVRVGPDGSIRSSAVFACVNLVARTIASLPLLVYRRLAGDDRERATDNPAYALLRRRPNRWQTSFDWLYLKTAHLLLRGNNVDRIYADPRTGEVTDLWPLMPDTVSAERAPSGRLRYRVRPPSGEPYVLLDDEVAHVRDYAPDGIWGLSRITLGAQGIGLALAAEAYGSRFFANNAQPGLILEHPKALSEKARLNIENSVMRRTADRNQFRPFVAEEDMKVKQLAISGKDAQLVESRVFQVADIARWFGVPLFMIGMEEKSTSWGSGIEEQKNGFVTFTIGPFLELYAQILNAALFGDDDEYFCEFELKALLRGNTLARFQAYDIAARAGTGWMTRNEIRKSENLNRGPDELDEFLDPLNTAPSGAPRGTAPDDGVAAFAILAADAGERIAEREARDIEHRPKRIADAPERFAAWADGYYAEHTAYVERTLEPLASAWLRATGGVVPVALTGREITARGRQAADPCPVGADLETWRTQRAAQVAGIIEAALAPQTLRRVA